MRAAKAGQNSLRSTADKDLKLLCDIDDVVELVQKYPTTNECTHFACVLDPTEGTVAWCRRWMKPITSKWISNHMSDDYTLD